MPNIHPMLVHFPIALIFVVAFCDLAGILLGKKSLIQTANIVSIFAALAAIAALITGTLAEDAVEGLPGIHDLLETHETLGYIFLGIAIVNAIVRLALGGKSYDRFKWIGLVLSIAGSAVVGYGGYLGGEMVFTHGAGVNKAAISANMQGTSTQQPANHGGEEPENIEDDDD